MNTNTQPLLPSTDRDSSAGPPAGAGPVALVTGGTDGLGRALAAALADRGWQVVTDGRSEQKIKEADLPPPVTVVQGDVTDPAHREELAGIVSVLGRLDLLVHNASTLGPLPMRPLSDVEDGDLRRVLLANAEAPLALTRRLSPWLRESDGALLAITSDAAVEHYETWGLYGASKAALEHLTLTWAAETGLTAWAVDPGDMRTRMHQDAFPGEDISDRPLPGTVVPHLLALLDQRPASGRVTAREVVVR